MTLGRPNAHILADVQGAWKEGKKLLRASRAHANFAEYVPLTITLLFAIEYLGGNGYFLHIAGALLVLGRVVHAYGISQLKEQLNFRVFGMLCTFICMALSSCYLLYTRDH